MAEPGEGLEDMLRGFEAEYDARNPNLSRNLRDLIERSPSLKSDLQQSIADGNLKEIRIFESNANNTGAEYSRKRQSIQIPESDLLQYRTSRHYDEEMIFKLGHEMRHAMDRANATRGNDRFNNEVWRISESAGTRHDYTTVVADFIDENRQRESYAHIGGFNAISSMARMQNPDATLKDIYEAYPARMADFIEVAGVRGKSFSLKEGLTLDANMQMP